MSTLSWGCPEQTESVPVVESLLPVTYTEDVTKRHDGIVVWGSLEENISCAGAMMGTYLCNTRGYAMAIFPGYYEMVEKKSFICFIGFCFPRNQHWVIQMVGIPRIFPE